MKKNRPKTGDRSHSLSMKELASVRGGGIQGSGFAADDGVIRVPNDNGVIHME
jgi:hypothetical protein